MTLENARRVLGLAPGDDPAEFLDELSAAREKIAGMARSAPSDTLALRYREGLDEFDAALALVRGQLDAGRLAEKIRHSGASPTPPRHRPRPNVKRNTGGGRRRRTRWVATVLALLLALGGGLWVFFRIRDDIQLRRHQKLTLLERQGAVLIEKRRWKQARLVYEKIRTLDPGSPVADFGFRGIETGIREEHQQYTGYWTGEALAAIDAKRWPDAMKAIAKLKERTPDNTEIAALRRQLAEARKVESRQRLLADAQAAFDRREWDQVRKLAENVLAESPDDPEALSLRERAAAEAERDRINLEKARKLFELAQRRDIGQFDAEALEWAREARSLAPNDKEIDDLYQKLSSYTRTIDVPGDFPTLAAAIEAARPRDRIRLGEGTWKESLTIDKTLEIEGSGTEKSIIECEAADGPVLTWDPEAAGARISGVELRHRTFAPGTKRFSVALVRGGNVMFSDCSLRDGSGHGLAVIEGGLASLTRCKLEQNGWDGVSAYGDGSHVEISACEAKGNFEHGFDVWDGASCVIRDSTATDNGRNGVFIATKAQLAVASNHLSGNREFGIVVASAAGGELAGNQVELNHLGGIALHREARNLQIRNNTTTRNIGPGLVLDTGFAAASYQGNTVTGNRATRQIAKNIDLSPPVPKPPKTETPPPSPYPRAKPVLEE